MTCATGSLYELIGVSERATRGEIERACLKKAASNLPENNPDDPDAAVTFRQVQRVFEVLGDPVRRAAYDRELAAQPQVDPEPEAVLPATTVEEEVPAAEDELPPEVAEEFEPPPKRKSPLKRAMEIGFVSGAVVALVAVLGVVGYEAVTKGPDTPVLPDRHQAAAPRIPS